MKYNLDISDSIRLEIHSEGSNKFALAILLCTASVVFLLPFIVLFLIILPNGDGVSFGFLTTLILSTFVSFYLIRLYLWNKYGKEVYIIEKGKITYYYYYKLFKDHHKEIEFKSIEAFILRGDELIEVSCIERMDNEEENIYFVLDEDAVETATKKEVPISVIIEINNNLRKFKKSN